MSALTSPSLTPATLLQATRAYSFPASVVPVLLGTTLAARGYANGGHGTFQGAAFALTVIGAVLAHFGANVLNDYFDFVNGVDTKPEHGSGVLTGGLMTRTQTLGFGLALLAGAGVCGLLLLRDHVAVVLPLALTGLGCAVLYPALLKRFALGDFLIILAFGLGLTLGAYGVQTNTLSAHQWLLVSLYAVPVSLLVDAILHANNLRDAPDDRMAHVRTLATLLSPKAGLILQQVLLFGPIVFVGVSVLLGFLPLWSLLTFLSLPLLLTAYKTGSVPGTAQTHLIFGVLYATSFLFKPVFV
jgi:1,4-dihydroxy-2-naphthoate octaprenyltransferase